MSQYRTSHSERVADRDGATSCDAICPRVVTAATSGSVARYRTAHSTIGDSPQSLDVPRCPRYQRWAPVAA
eukprot:3941201-Rhodomonas_salina.13